MWNIFWFIVQVVLYFVTMASLSSKKPNAAKLEDLSVPEVSETKSIAIAYGKYKQKSPNLIWYGDLSTAEITEEVGNWISSEDVTVGYRYYLTQWYALAHGVVNFHELYMDDKLVWTNEGQTGNYTARYGTEKGLFMDEREYFEAKIDFYSGDQTHTQNNHLDAQGIDPPVYDGICHMVFRGVVDSDVEGRVDISTRGALIGNSLNLRPLAFVCSRYPDIPEFENQDIVNINDDCNPAFIIYDILTANKYGLGLKKDLIDIDSFKQAAQTLYDEEFGVSIIYEDKFRCDEFVNEVLRNIAGNLIEDAITGKLKLKLTRQDYNEEDLLLFDENNVIEVDSFSRTTKNELYNEVKVTYTNSENNYKESIAMFQNLGLDFTDRAAKQRSVTLSFPWITKPELAARVANREAVPMTSVLSNIVIKTHIIEGLEVGDVFKFSWDDYGIKSIVFRIQQINYGNLNSNTMTISAIQDSFNLNFTTYSPGGDNKFEDINLNPKAMNLPFIETPYFINDIENGLLFYPPINDLNSKYYEVYIKEDHTTDYIKASDNYKFTSYFSLQSDVTKTSEIRIKNIDELNITNANNADRDAGKNLLFLRSTIDDKEEFISFKTITQEAENVYLLGEVKRGCLDTLPQDWSENTACYIMKASHTESKNVDLDINESIKLKAVATTGSGTYDFNAAVEIDYTMKGEKRNVKPILPSDLKANNNTFLNGDITIGQTNLSLTWGYRNLISQSKVKGFYDNDTNNISNVNYDISIYDNDTNTLLKNTSVNVDNYIFDDETTINPDGLYYNNLRVEVKSVLSAEISKETIIFNVLRS